MSPETYYDEVKMTGKKKIGFAAMNPERQKEIARKGGANVPADKRSFAQNRDLAATAGRRGGENVSADRRSFSTNRELARAAGKKGGRKTQKLRAVETEPESPTA